MVRRPGDDELCQNSVKGFDQFIVIGPAKAIFKRIKFAERDSGLVNKAKVLPILGKQRPELDTDNSYFLVKPIDSALLGLLIDRAIDHRVSRTELSAYRKHLEDMVREKTDAIHNSFINVIAALAEALEAKDPYTRGHSQRVAQLGRRIAMRLGASDTLQEDIYRAGLVHDLGKIGIRESVLLKPDRLTPEEFEHIKEHPDLGVRIVHPVIQDNLILEAIRHHHERVDGQGYPDGLKGSEIPFVAQALAVADAYDAMTSDRPYRKAMPPGMATAILKKVAGTQLSERAVKAFLDVRAEDSSLEE